MSNVRPLKVAFVTSLNRIVVLSFGAALTALGLGMLLSGGLSLPTRSPPLRFHFTGMSLLLLGGSPLLLGVVMLAIARGSLDSASPVTRGLLGAGIVLLALAFLAAPKI
jgi:hypothetical protein